MHLDIISIGNSKGIRLPKTLIEHCGFGKVVEVEIKEDCLIIKGISIPRKGWLKAFSTMAKNKDDTLIDPSQFSQEWDQKEWEW